MYQTLLVPLDGSPFGERALPMATAIARMTQAKVVLVRAAWAAARPGEDPIEVEQKAVDQAATYLAGVAQRLAEQGIQTETAVPYASANEGILVEVDVRHADMVIMCTHGRSGLGRWVYGSVAEAVLAKSTLPVILVPLSGPLRSISLAPGASAVLVPLDGSAFAESSLPAAVDIARASKGRLILLRIVSPPIGYYPDPVLGQPYVSEVGERILEEEQLAAESYLATVAERLGKNGLPVQSFVRVGWPTDAILEEARNAGAELIAMATHGKTGLGDLLLGSVTLDVLRRGGLPLLLVRPGRLRTQ